MSTSPQENSIGGSIYRLTLNPKEAKFSLVGQQSMSFVVIILRVPRHSIFISIDNFKLGGESNILTRKEKL